MRITRRLRINVEPQRVWELIDNDDKLSSWMPHIVATHYPDGRPETKTKGTRFRHEMTNGELVASYPGEITEYQPGTLVGMLLEPEALRMHAVYHVTGDEDWTMLEYGCDVRATSVKGYLLVWFSKKTLNRIVDQQLTLLKLVAEGKIDSV